MVEHVFLAIGWWLLVFCFQSRNMHALKARQERTAHHVYKELVEKTNREAHEHWREANRLRAELGALRRSLR